MNKIYILNEVIHFKLMASTPTHIGPPEDWKNYECFCKNNKTNKQTHKSSVQHVVIMLITFSCQVTSSGHSDYDKTKGKSAIVEREATKCKM